MNNGQEEAGEWERSGQERKERLEVGGDETKMSGFFIEMGAKNVEL